MTAKLQFAQFEPVVAEKQGVLRGKNACGPRLDSMEIRQKYEYLPDTMTESKSHRADIGYRRDTVVQSQIRPPSFGLAIGRIFRIQTGCRIRCAEDL